MATNIDAWMPRANALQQQKSQQCKAQALQPESSPCAATKTQCSQKKKKNHLSLLCFKRACGVDGVGPHALSLHCCLDQSLNALLGPSCLILSRNWRQILSFQFFMAGRVGASLCQVTCPRLHICPVVGRGWTSRLWSPFLTSAPSCAPLRSLSDRAVLQGPWYQQTPIFVQAIHSLDVFIAYLLCQAPF